MGTRGPVGEGLQQQSRTFRLPRGSGRGAGMVPEGQELSLVKERGRGQKRVGSARETPDNTEGAARRPAWWGDGKG